MGKYFSSNDVAIPTRYYSGVVFYTLTEALTDMSMKLLSC